MKKKDFTAIYNEYLEYHVNSYAIKVEELYKKLHLEGSAEINAFNSCLDIIERKDKSKEPDNPSFSLAYSKFKKSGSLVRNNDLNVLYEYHIFPESQDLNIEMNEGIFEKCLNDFAVERASKLVYSWFSSWRNLYSMMFRLNDFSDFELIRNSDFYERNDLFVKYHKRLYPNSYRSKNEKENFKIKKEFKESIEDLWMLLTDKMINEELTAFDDYVNVFTKNWNEHNSKIYFKCSPEEAGYFLFVIKFAFSKLSFASIHRSKLFYTKEGNVFLEDNLSKQKNRIIPEQKIEINKLLESVGLFFTDQIPT